MQSVRYVALLTAAVMLLGGCDSKQGSLASDLPQPVGVFFAERAVAPISQPNRPGAVTLWVINLNAEAVVVTGVDFETDAGLEATLLGATTCRYGCLGAGEFSGEDRDIAREGIEYEPPFELVAESIRVAEGMPRQSIVVVLTPTDPDLARERCLRLLTMTLYLDGAPDVVVGALKGQEWVAGLTLLHPPPGYSDCPED